MHLHLGGQLSWYDSQKRAQIEIHLREPIALRALLDQLGVPRAEIAIAALDGVAVEIENAIVHDEDRVDVYPPVGGGIFSAK
ncbi:MAG: MoaD/ThiS family protein [Chloroflexi bacterium]|nr:MoaD/ThiS family protein [Chloroflexota bacterium]